MCSELWGPQQTLYKQQLLDFKNKPGIKICVILMICKRSKMFRYSFRKDLPFTSVQSSPSDQGGASPLPKLDHEGQLDKGFG